MGPLLGAIADDFTGATDLASFMVRSGMRTIQLIGVPTEPLFLPEVDGVVIALKSRTQPTAQAVRDSREALAYLQRIGCSRFYFKYCSTFDSTEEGNIGPVADHLLQDLDTTTTIVCPALPVNGRTVFNGYLFVNGRLLNESGMENHPLTPMTDPDLVRFLGKQTGGRVALINSEVVQRGAEAIRQKLAELSGANRYVIIDAITEADLIEIGHACSSLTLVTGGSGLVNGLVDSYLNSGLLTRRPHAQKLAPVAGDAIILSGSCSAATREQVAAYQSEAPSLQIDPLALHDGRQSLARIMEWFDENRARGPVLISATEEPERVRMAQQRLGAEPAGQLVETLFSDIAREAVKRRVRKFIVAGGETSGAIVNALGVQSMVIGPSIAPGVPLTQSLSSPKLLLALKSGNFGDRLFFQKAVAMMDAHT